jgi:hypothetical protein
MSLYGYQRGGGSGPEGGADKNFIRLFYLEAAFRMAVPNTSVLTKTNKSQISENIYCNSEAYNIIFDSVVVCSGLRQIETQANSILQQNLAIFSQFLKVRSTPTGATFTLNGEIDRRDLKVRVNIPRTKYDPLQLLVVNYTYIFDVYDTKNTYLPRQIYGIGAHRYECIGPVGRNMYTFKSNNECLWHVSFHAPNTAMTPVEKSVGAFHIRMDTFGTRIFRAFIPHPVGAGAEFYHFHDIDRNMDRYYTSKYPVPPTNEVGNYMSKHHTLERHNLLNMVVAPIYDMIVDRVLNPLIHINLPAGTVIPIPSPHQRGVPIKYCSDMKINPDPRPRWFGGKKGQYKTRSNKSFKRRTMKREGGIPLR